MTTEQGKSRSGEALRATVGVVFVIVGRALTFLWFYDAVHALVYGEPGPAVEGLAPADAPARAWRAWRPSSTCGATCTRSARRRPRGLTSLRQLFVALIVTAATLLADRDSLTIPFVATPFTGAVALIFRLSYRTLTVLWFMQIFPKHMAATNADRYLKVFQAALFPSVEFVRVIGISWPAENHTHRSEPAQIRTPSRPLETVASRHDESLAKSLAALVPVGRAPRDPV